MFHKTILPFLVMVTACRETAVTPPAPVHPIPSQRQLDWQELEFYAFVHFNMNTFSNMEWGFGDEKPNQFNPTQLDCRQWAREFKEAGMKGVILTAKHHDGFCLWPSKYTEHSVKNSKWKDGKGDVVRELAEACREYGLKLGVYLSPWDRNHPDYGKPEYITYFRNQLRELLTNYGEVFEVWFDGANGGTGWYGGANEERRVDKLSYYDWGNTYPIIRELQPNAVIFSDAGPDIRWVGNESGYAYPTTWSNLMRDEVYGGMPEYAKEYSMGQERGTHWVPAEVDVSIRPGWYYHEYEDHKVKSLPELVDIYYHSIGRNGSLLLNFPVDKRGLVHENDVRQLKKLAETIRTDFKNDLALGQKIDASNVRGGDFEADRIVDGDAKTYWAAEDGVIQAEIIIEFNEPTAFNRFLVQEFIALGQRVKAFSLEAKTEDGWREIASETTIGYKRILRLPDVTANAVKFKILDAKACPVISNIEINRAPKLIVPPKITRDKAGEVSLTAPEDGVQMYFTADRSPPSKNANLYEKPFSQTTPATIQAVTFDPETQHLSEPSRIEFDIAKAQWRVLHNDENAQNAIDDNEQTWWAVPKNAPQEIIIDLGEKFELKGFTYMPMQARWISGFIQNYEFLTSANNREWELTAKGEFSNILNSPTLRRVVFDKTPARYIKLRILTTVDNQPASFAEIGVLTK